MAGPRTVLSLLFALSAALSAQTPSLLPANPPPAAVPRTTDPSVPPSPSDLSAPPAPLKPSSSLPDAPVATAPAEDVVTVAHDAYADSGDPPPRLGRTGEPLWNQNPHPGPIAAMYRRRNVILNPYQRFLNDEVKIPLTPTHKAYIAATDFIDPGNLAVIALSSGVYIASDAHNPYGPGWKGFASNYGYSLSQDATGEFFGTFLIPSLVHQDPRYYRMPGAPVRRRIVHALAHTFVTQHDDGTRMPNYATLLTYPISAEISNLYIPGVHGNGPSTVARIATGLASDPAEALIGEFLPDLSRRIHIRIVFIQQLVNSINTGPSM